jgi:hypothetical protein
MGRYAMLALLLLALLMPNVAAAGDPPPTTHFRFEPDDGSRGIATHLASIAEEKRRFVLATLGVADERVIEVRVASSEEAMERMVGTDRPVREWIAGLAISEHARIVMSARGNEVFRASDTFVHELAHLYLDSAAGGGRLPRWFHEGVAMLVASEELGERLKTLLGAAATGSFLEPGELTDGFPMDPPAVHLAYAESMMFVRFLHKRHGGEGIRSVLRQVRSGLPFDLAFDDVYGASPEALWARFERTIDPAASLIVFLTSAGLVWMLILVLFLYVYWRKRRRVGARREAWELEEELARVRQSQAGPDPYEVN